MLSSVGKSTRSGTHRDGDGAQEKNASVNARSGETNPIQVLADRVVRGVADAYSEYLYGSGILLCFACIWAAYPSFLRYRHAHLMRYQRRQIQFQRWFFATPHIPRWDKKYLERMTVPSLVPSTAAVSVTEHCSGLDDIVAEQPACSAFAAGTSEASHITLLTSLHKINAHRRAALMGRVKTAGDLDAETMALQRVLHNAVREAGFVVVMKEPTTRGTHGEGCICDAQQWFLSSEEARRREFCRFWIAVLVFARVMQDLLYVPDFPDQPIS